MQAHSQAACPTSTLEGYHQIHSITVSSQLPSLQCPSVDCNRSKSKQKNMRFWFTIMQPFIFCRSDLLNKPEDFSTFSSVGDVVLDTCTSDHQPENMWANQIKVNKCIPNIKKYKKYITNTLQKLNVIYR